jgi:gliding motility-associated-like protein
MLKRLTFLFFLIVFAYPVLAQLTASDDAKFYSFTVTKDNYTIHIYMFNGIENTTEFDAGSNDAVWYTFDNQTTPISSGTSKLYKPDDATGYILDINGEKTYIWVFDYKNYIPTFNSFKAEDDPYNQCESLNLLLDANVPELTYKSPLGVSYTLSRTFKITYNTLTWSSSEWSSATNSFSVELPNPVILVTEAPLCDTQFIIKGDQYAEELNIDSYTFTSDLYTAVAVECHITSEAVTRSEKNEEDRPEESSAISGSSPLELFFSSNGNTPVTTYYHWTITKSNDLLVDRTDVDHRYTFVDAGTYKVKLVVSNDYCSYSDSMTVTVSTSALEVPNVFTPDGNGQNDEFRVGYKSIVSFQCWVYNRWGRLVYYWNDPQKGWDGNIKGRPASVGPYFYVIKAIGADGITYSKKGDINLLREKE